MTESFKKIVYKTGHSSPVKDKQENNDREQAKHDGKRHREKLAKKINEIQCVIGEPQGERAGCHGKEIHT